MILDSSLSLQAALAGAVSANQPEVHVDFVEYALDGRQTRPGTQRSALNSNTDVTILTAPAGNVIRVPEHVSVYNKDTASVTVTVKTDDGSTERIETKQALATLETLCWDKGVGWYVI